MSKVAIIEDDITISQMYRMKLESDGLEVITASDGAAGVELAKNNQADAILLDLMMPKMNGVEALRAIRKIPGYENIPVLVLTNMGIEEKPVDLDDLNINGYIIKADSPPRETLQKVKAILDNPNLKLNGIVLHEQ